MSILSLRSAAAAAARPFTAGRSTAEAMSVRPTSPMASMPALAWCKSPSRRATRGSLPASRKSSPGPSVCRASSSEGSARQPYTSGLSAEEILAVPVERRRKTTAEECPFCADAPVKENDSKCLGICRNPQNVPGPEVFPHVMQECADAVRLQLNAMRDLNVPRKNHGLQVMYQFAVEAGRMERSRYFGLSTDMYHFDHFMGKALHHFRDMIGMQEYEIGEPQLRDDGRTNVEVEITDNVGETSKWTFIMVQRTFGKYEGCWCTHRVMPSDSKFLPDV